MANSTTLARLCDWAAFKLYGRASKLVAVSRAVAEDIEQTAKLPAGAVDVIYNPAWSEQLALQAAQPCPHPWLDERDVPVIVSAGRLTQAKDFPTLLRAFAALLQTQPAKLIVFGEGEERAKLETLIAELELTEHCQLPGHVPNPLAYVSKADLFVLSSAWEGFGNVLVEALGCGLTVVATDCPGGPREILANGQYGYLVPVGDAARMTEAMHHALSNPFSPDAQRTGALRFTFERSARQYLELFDDDRHQPVGRDLAGRREAAR